MAAEEDNFDIDIYGDGGEDYQDDGQGQNGEQHDLGQDVTGASELDSALRESGRSADHGRNNTSDANREAHPASQIQQMNSGAFQANKAQPMQSLKRKEGGDERQLDHGATTALFISDLHWWITDDDVRGWVNQSSCEDELRDITFHEHKVNGKSKGQAYVSLVSPQAATAVKHKIDSLAEAQVYKQKFAVSFANPSTNPFKTLPKDGNARNNNNSNNTQSNRSSSGNFSSGSLGGQPQGNYNSGGYRGRGGYNNRGGFNRGGFSQPVPGSYQGGGMGGFQAPAMGGMQSYNNFGNRGAMMGGAMRGGPMNMRGGRGGMNQGNMMGGYMGGMAMGGMPAMGMAMPQMNGAMGMQGFPNPGFFPQQGAVDSNWNPHGAKRTRQE